LLEMAILDAAIAKLAERMKGVVVLRGVIPACTTVQSGTTMGHRVIDALARREVEVGINPNACIDHRDGSDAIRLRRGHGQRHIATGRGAGDDDLIDGKRVEEVLGVIGERVDLIARCGRVTQSVAAQIGGNKPARGLGAGVDHKIPGPRVGLAAVKH